MHRQIQQMHKMPRGTIFSRQQGQMMMVLWRDTKVVSLLSTCHQGYRDGQHTREKGEKVASNKDVPAPPHAMDYTRFMGGVDKADQYRSYQSCSRQSMAWWRKILYFLIDVAHVNAWLCYKANIEDQSGTPVSHRMFTVAIATSLIGGFAQGTPAYHQPIAPTICA